MNNAHKKKLQNNFMPKKHFKESNIVENFNKFKISSNGWTPFQSKRDIQ